MNVDYKFNDKKLSDSLKRIPYFSNYIDNRNSVTNTFIIIMS